MKKTFRNTFMMLAAITLSMGFVACSEDEDNGNGGGGGGSIGSGKAAVSSVMTTDDGKKMVLTNRGSRAYTYDSNGRCTSVTQSGETLYSFSHNPFKLTHFRFDSDSDSDNGTCEISVTEDGYAAHAKSVEGGEYRKEETVGYCKYDKEGHLTEINAHKTFIYNYNGKKETEKYPCKWTLKWKNGNLSTITYTEEGYEDRATFTYGNQPNKYNQYTVAYKNAIDLPMFEELLYIGIFGKGSAYLPISVTQEENGDITTTELSYDINPDGTIAKEHATYHEPDGYSYSETYNYTYREIQ